MYTRGMNTGGESVRYSINLASSLGPYKTLTMIAKSREERRFSRLFQTGMYRTVFTTRAVFGGMLCLYIKRERKSTQNTVRVHQCFVGITYMYIANK